MGADCSSSALLLSKEPILSAGFLGMYHRLISENWRVFGQLEDQAFKIETHASFRSSSKRRPSTWVKINMRILISGKRRVFCVQVPAPSTRNKRVMILLPMRSILSAHSKYHVCFMSEEQYYRVGLCGLIRNFDCIVEYWTLDFFNRYQRL